MDDLHDGVGRERLARAVAVRGSDADAGAHALGRALTVGATAGPLDARVARGRRSVVRVDAHRGRARPAGSRCGVAGAPAAGRLGAGSGPNALAEPDTKLGAVTDRDDDPDPVALAEPDRQRDRHAVRLADHRAVAMRYRQRQRERLRRRLTRYLLGSVRAYVTPVRTQRSS
jgi:hypothetical protein